MTENVVSSLCSYQIETIERQITDYQSINLAEKKTEFDICPKCGMIHSRRNRGGKLYLGKQMYHCKECDKRFTYDNGHLTWYFHQPYHRRKMIDKAVAIDEKVFMKSHKGNCLLNVIDRNMPAVIFRRSFSSSYKRL